MKNPIVFVLLIVSVQANWKNPVGVFQYYWAHSLQEVVFDWLFINIMPYIVQNEDLGWQISEKLFYESMCPVCEATAWAVSLNNNQITETFIIGSSTITCELFIPFFGFSSQICSDLVQQQIAEELLPVVQEFLSGNTFCTFVIPVCNRDKWKQVDVEQWAFDKIERKPQNTIGNNFVNNLYSKPSSGLIKVAIFTDLHVDYQYQAGNNKECDQSVCCRADSGIATTAELGAGEWGEYNCDMPQKTMMNMFKYIKEHIQPDMVFWGGDSVAHNIDTQSRQKNIESLKRTNQNVLKGLSGIKTYITLGNHDTYPQDSFKAEKSEILSQMHEDYAPFFDTQQERQTFNQYGFYSSPLTYQNGTQIGNSRLISLNTNFCYLWNWQQLTQFSDPGDQLQWLEVELSELEEVGGQAIILAHIPNTDQCTPQFGRRWHALMDRFQHIVRWTMNGHVHKEAFTITRDLYTHQPIGMNFVVGSASPYILKWLEGKNPDFQVVYIDAQTLIPVDIETHSMDLERANHVGQPVWQKTFDYRKAYNLKDLSPKSFMKLANQILFDEETAKKFRNHRRINHKSVSQNIGCDYACRKELYCSVIQGDRTEHEFCMGHDKTNFWSGEQAIMSLSDLFSHWYQKI